MFNDVIENSLWLLSNFRWEKFQKTIKSNRRNIWFEHYLKMQLEVVQAVMHHTEPLGLFGMYCGLNKRGSGDRMCTAD